MDRCEICGLTVQLDQIRQIDSGERLCPVCLAGIRITSKPESINPNHQQPIQTEPLSAPGKAGCLVITLSIVVVSILGFLFLVHSCDGTPPTTRSHWREHASESRRLPSKSRRLRVQSQSRKWYQGGTLHNKSALEWQMASADDKLATCADFVARMWEDQSFVPKIQNSINSVESMKIYAEELVICLDAATERFADPEQNRRVYANQTVSSMATLGMMTMRWLK